MVNCHTISNIQRQSTVISCNCEIFRTISKCPLSMNEFEVINSQCNSEGHTYKVVFCLRMSYALGLLSVKLCHGCVMCVYMASIWRVNAGNIATDSVQIAQDLGK